MSSENLNPSYFWTPFYPQASLANFTNTERTLLEKHGSFMEDIMTGLFRPTTLSQHHFLALCKGEVAPENVMEQTWRKYRLAVIEKKVEEMDYERLHANPYTTIGADLPHEQDFIEAWQNKLAAQRDSVSSTPPPLMSLYFSIRKLRRSTDIFSSGSLLPGSFNRKNDWPP